MENKELVSQAFAAMKKAYAPYSGYKVGAAILTKSGKVYTGCNIENAAYSPTVCAERTAFFKAVSEGEKEFEKIAVCGGKDGGPEDYFFPCGVCRQVMAEFCEADFSILTAKSPSDYKENTLAQMLPDAFTIK
ncbi:MAG: cytidine deaminase [Clostridia bacterium]|nr:cytidine deaminase [Clostridia bacterium]